MIYLDYAATTPVDPRVANLLAQHLTLDGGFANPASTSHRLGNQAAAAVAEARAQIAAVIGCQASEIVFTSGATEANNIAIKGAALGYRKRGQHIVTCKTEHYAVLDVCRSLERDGFAVTYLDPDSDGLISADTFAQALRPDTVLASIMQVNNETGVVQDLATLGRIAREHNVLFHVDGAQGIGKMPTDVYALNIDLLSICGHKIYAPKGIGALFVRRQPKVRLIPVIHGGGHERGLRPGTLPTHQIVALGGALALAQREMAAESTSTRRLRGRLSQGLLQLPGVQLNGHPTACAPTILNIAFAGVSSEALLYDWRDCLAVATGSACTSATNEPSHVLRSMGVSDLLAQASIRFSLGRFTTEAEIDQAIMIVTKSVSKLRVISPFWHD